MRVSTNSAKNLRMRLDAKALWAIGASIAAVLLTIAVFTAKHTQHGHVVHQFSAAGRLAILAGIVVGWMVIAVIVPYAE